MNPLLQTTVTTTPHSGKRRSSPVALKAPLANGAYATGAVQPAPTSLQHVSSRFLRRAQDAALHGHRFARRWRRRRSREWRRHGRGGAPGGRDAPGSAGEAAEEGQGGPQRDCQGGGEAAGAEGAACGGLGRGRRRHLSEDRPCAAERHAAAADVRGAQLRDPPRRGWPLRPGPTGVRGEEQSAGCVAGALHPQRGHAADGVHQPHAARRAQGQRPRGPLHGHDGARPGDRRLLPRRPPAGRRHRGAAGRESHDAGQREGAS
eukprot:scaffold1790_cov257-Pinguiococcus_pyrenoidosus.AAC.13